MSTLPNHSHLTPQEVALFLRIRVRSVYRLCTENDLPHVQWAGVIRIPRAEFIRWYQQHSQHISRSQNIV